MSASVKWLALIVTLMAASPAAAQDQGLDLLLFAGLRDRPVHDVQAQTTQLYRIPLALTLRGTKDGRVGLRVTFPVSLSSVRVHGVSDLKPFVRKLGIAAIVPGIEFQIPAGNLHLRPFAEAGIGKGTGGGKAEVLYGAGMRARVDQSVRSMKVTLGGSAMHRKRGTGGGRNDGHSMFEGAVDSQLPLGFSIGSKQARGGIYTIVRASTGWSCHARIRIRSCCAVSSKRASASLRHPISQSGRSRSRGSPLVINSATSLPASGSMSSSLSDS